MTPLRAPALRWLFEQLGAAADRRGDPHLTAGKVSLVVPDDAPARAAARGLLGGAELRPRQRRTIELGVLTGRLRARGPALTPGAAAAHVLNRQLAMRAQAAAERVARAGALRDVLGELLEQRPATLAPGSDTALLEQTWTAMVRSGTSARLLATPDPATALRTSWAVLVSLPPAGTTVDRRVLAQQVTSDPHALDLGAPLATFVLALASATGLLDARLRGPLGWERLGVLGDDALGGLLTVGLAPLGWRVPLGAVLGLSPRELVRAEWPEPFGSGVVFVTENPSVLTAAADQVGVRGRGSPLVCTSGTPSTVEVSALDGLGRAGWQVRVRADFDVAGLGHVRALLAGVRGARPWRMASVDYRASLDETAPGDPTLARVSEMDTPWDPELAAAVADVGRPAFEEALLPELLSDLCETTAADGS